MRSLIKDYSLFLYSGKLFDESVLDFFTFTNGKNIKLKSGSRIAVLIEHDRPKNQGVDYLLPSRQKKITAILTLFGFDSVILTNCNISKKRGEEIILKILEASEVGKIGVNSVSTYSTNNDACPIPEAIVHGLNLKIDY